MDSQKQDPLVKEIIQTVFGLVIGAYFGGVCGSVFTKGDMDKVMHFNNLISGAFLGAIFSMFISIFTITLLFASVMALLVNKGVEKIMNIFGKPRTSQEEGF